MKFDPVCGTAISPEAAISTARYRGETYFFCSVMCKLAFDQDPRAYLKEPLPPSDTGAVDESLTATRPTLYTLKRKSDS